MPIAILLFTMCQKPLIRVSDFPYHITARSNNQGWFYLPTPEIWEIFSQKITKIANSYNVKIHSFVLMSNHFHALLSTPHCNLNEAMLYFMRESCKSINRTANRINHIFGGPYTWSVITNPFYYGLAYKYIFRNPVKAGIVRRVEEYPFSTVLADFFAQPTPFPVSASRYDFHLPFGSNLAARLEWLNRSFAMEEDECVRSGLRRKTFEIKPSRVTKRIPPSFRHQMGLHQPGEIVLSKAAILTHCIDQSKALPFE